MPRLQQTQGLSDKKAKALFHASVRFGDHFESGFRFCSDSEVKARLLGRGYNYGAVISALRVNRSTTIPLFENMVFGRPVMKMQAGGAEVEFSLVRNDGIVLETNHLSGSDHAFIGPDWQYLLRDALRERARVINEGDRSAANSMLTNGFAALEAFLNFQAHSYSLDNASIQVSEKDRRYTLQEKLSDWLTTILGFPPSLLDDECWQACKRLSSYRDDGAIHPKPGAGIKTLGQVRDVTNDFAVGIGALFFRLLFLFGEPIPMSLLRVLFEPDVVLVRD